MSKFSPGILLKLLKLVCVILVVTGCTRLEGEPLATSTTVPILTSTASPVTSATVSSEAFSYLASALDIMQENSIKRSEINWDMLRATANEKARGARAPWATYNAIRFALNYLGDEHSFFLTPLEATHLQNTAIQDSPTPEGNLIEGKLGYIILPWLSGIDEEQGDLYATLLQNIVKEVDSLGPCGWIIDLRPNNGGTMWPMLAGIGPVLGDGDVGSFVYPDGRKIDWYYTNGQVQVSGGDVMAKVNGVAYELKQDSQPVAVLTGMGTASSGEAVVVAFRGRPNTRSFGQDTAGLSTGNQGFKLSNGAMIFLTVVTFADRTGQIYGGPIRPDELINEIGSGPDPVKQAAVRWLLDQPECVQAKQQN